MGAQVFALPGQQILPQNYHSAVVLYTAGETASAVVDGAPPGPRGRLYIVEPNKPTRVPAEAARFILEHLPWTGVVAVRETETDTGVTYDLESAKQESMAQLEVFDRRRFDAYVQSCVTDYIAHPAGKRPVPPPPDSILRIIERRGYDLKKYGIEPLGWESPDKDKRLTDSEAQIATLKAMVDDLRTRLGDAPPTDDGKKAKK